MPTATRCILLSAAAACTSLLAAQERPDWAATLRQFLSTEDPATQLRACEALKLAEPTPLAVYEALAKGRPLPARPATGVVSGVLQIAGKPHPYRIMVPRSYNPARAYPVRFELHGGMGAEEWDPAAGKWCAPWRPARNRIIVLPAGWDRSMWWERSQVANFARLLRLLKRRYHVDENRIVLSGNSDGGAALYFQAMRCPDPWAAYNGFVAPPDRLCRKEFRVDGQMHMCNLAGQRFVLTFGQRDRLVPVQHLRKYLDAFTQAGALLDTGILEGQGHGLRLPPARQRAHTRVFGRVRDPLPDKLSWATEDPERYGLRSWVKIDALGEADEPAAGVILPRHGTAIQLRGPSMPRRPFGRLDVARQGNAVRIKAQNVRRFRLLIAPGEFDLQAPLRIEVEGHPPIIRRIEPSLEVLLRWTMELDDLQRLFVAEVAVDLGG